MRYSIGTALAVLALATAWASGPTSPQDLDAQSIHQFQTAYDQQQADVQRLCPLIQSSPKVQPGASVLKADVADMATNPQGPTALAVLDLNDSRVVVYPLGLSKAPVAIKMLGEFTGGSLKISSDGRYVAWIAGALSVYDIAKAKLQEIQPLSRPCADQWIGDELLVRDCPWHLVTLALTEGGGFTPVQTVEDGFRPPKRHAISDQLGETFMSGSEVFGSRGAAEASGAIVDTPVGFASSPLRVGRDLFVLRTSATGPATAEENEFLFASTDNLAPKLVRVSDAKTLDLRDHTCLPRYMAASPSGATFAMLQGGSLIQVLDPKTLEVIAAFKLDSTWTDAPAQIAYASETTMLVRYSKGVVRYELPTGSR
jgi:hypothetical protein